MNREELIVTRVVANVTARYGLDMGRMVREENDMRRKIVDAIGMLKRLVVEFRDDEWILRAAQEAMGALKAALKEADEMIGITLSERSDREMGFVSSRDRRAGKWTSIAGMRKELDEMSAQVGMWLSREHEAVWSGKAGFSYEQYYGAAMEAIDDCADKLRKIERMV